jgi:pimeloyl-ACP methyl ester carboxylesterase
MSLSVIGHSWGGYSTMNIVSIHPEITHIVAIAGFVSVKRMIKQSFNGIIRGYAKPMYEIECKTNPAHSHQDAAETLKNSSVKALLIYSDNDPIVNINHHYRILEEQLKDKENVTLVLVSGKKHNPNFTLQALEYKDKFFADLKKAKKAKLLESPEQKAAFIAKYDWHKMTEQDEGVWEIILDHLAK